MSLFKMMVFNHQMFCSRCLASCAKLLGKKIVNVTGPQSNKLLQGLFTNDINKVAREKVIYSHLLNVKGRILYDNFVYFVEDDSYHIEVDSSHLHSFVKLLKMYNIRSKAKITVEDIDVFASVNSTEVAEDCETHNGYADPRLSLLGRRFLGSPPADYEIVPEDEYHSHRVNLGVSEGSRDITYGRDFPFEHNLDYLNGVSFSKGCYIGQELTARTHHVGETRKRVVPVSISGTVPETALPAKLTAGKRAAGKLLSVYGNKGLAIIRFPYLDMDLSVSDSGGKCLVRGSKPEWWPSDIS